jgi:hypothetical protein
VSARYKIRRITPASALRVGCAAGWLVALCPALCLAGVAVQVLQRINQAFARIEPIEITVLGQQVARLDFLEILRLSAAAQIVARLVGSLPITFVLAAALLTLLGAVMLAVGVLFFSVGYNLLASWGGGLEVELNVENER